MKINLAFWDRLLRFFFGVLFLAWAIAGGPGWAYIGIYWIITSGWGLDPFYTLFRFRTVKLQDRSTISPD